MVSSNTKKLFNEYLRKKIKKIKSIHNYLTDQEITTALDKCSHDEDEAAARLTDFFFLNDIRKQIAIKEQEKENRSKDTNLSEDRKVFKNDRVKSSTSPTKKQTRQNRKLRLDDALKQHSEKNSFEGWSEARIKAYKLIDKNPNAYYYRFNPPGVEQKNGKWEKEERELFYNQMKKMGVNSQWGIFSMGIPGRVGYQCSNFYRFLIETGEIVDKNYVIDEKGKAHYLFSKGVSKKPRKNKPGEEEEPELPTIVNKRKRGRRKSKKNGEEDEDDDEYTPSISCRRQTEEGEELIKNSNPLSGTLDQFTCEEIEQPAISPYGHVLGKQTWSRCLSTEPRNRCPFTKQALTIRDLVLLTWDNIEQYRDKIVNT